MERRRAPAEIREEFERLQREREERRLQQRTNPKVSRPAVQGTGAQRQVRHLWVLLGRQNNSQQDRERSRLLTCPRGVLLKSARQLLSAELLPLCPGASFLNSAGTAVPADAASSRRPFPPALLPALLTLQMRAVKWSLKNVLTILRIFIYFPFVLEARGTGLPHWFIPHCACCG